MMLTGRGILPLIDEQLLQRGKLDILFLEGAEK
jgi:hypothetical protein